MANAAQLLINGWVAGTPVPASCSVGNSPDWYDTATNKLYSCVGGVYVSSTGGVTPPIVSALAIFANNAAAITGGLAIGQMYRTGADPDVVCIVH